MVSLVLLFRKHIMLYFLFLHNVFCALFSDLHFFVVAQTALVLLFREVNPGAGHRIKLKQSYCYLNMHVLKGMYEAKNLIFLFYFITRNRKWKQLYVVHSHSQHFKHISNISNFPGMNDYRHKNLSWNGETDVLNLTLLKSIL